MNTSASRRRKLPSFAPDSSTRNNPEVKKEKAVKSAPRQSGSPFAALLCCACLLLAPLSARASAEAKEHRFLEASQRAPSKEPKQTPARKSVAKARGRGERQQSRERQQAVAALSEVADAARALEDLDTRAEVLTLAADALWPADAPHARSIFRRAWEAARDADLASTKLEEEEARNESRRDANEPGVAERVDARLKILTALARRDPRMAEMFLAELKAHAERSTGEGGEGEDEGGGVKDEASRARRHVSERSLSRNGLQRLNVAFGLLVQGEYESAAQMAAPLVNEGPARDFVRFLLRLRPRAAREADALYQRLLARTASDPTASANDLLVLSSYVVSPHVFITISEEGSVQLYAMGRENGEDSEARDVPPAVRRAFFDVAAPLLLRPAQPPANEQETLAESSALYFAAGRLLPFFERDAPQYAPPLRARVEMLAYAIDAARRERLSAHMPTESLRQRNPSDPLEQFTKEMSDPVSRAERMGSRFRAVMEAARRRLWDRARKLAADIEDEDARRDALVVIACHQIKDLTNAYASDEDESDFERAAAFARAADVPPAVRAWGLAQAAEMAARKASRARAAELLEEAASFAEQAEKGSAQRISAFVLLTATASRLLDPSRARELLQQAVRAANDAEEALDAGAPVEEAAQLVSTASERRDELEDIFEPFRLDEVFATMARLDFARTLAEARILKDEAERAFATVAAARTVLDRIKK
jgi:hypothetical protein